MKRFALGVAFLCLLLSTSSSRAGTVFVTTLTGAKEVPPNDSPATGAATFDLQGGPGTWVLTYDITYQDLTTLDGLAGHIHDSTTPPNAPPTEQTGPIIHPLDELISPIHGDWRFDDATNPLTDAFAQKLVDGELYVNIHTQTFPPGEIRGQLIIPLPAPLWAGLLGLGAVAGYPLTRRLLRRRRQ